jgi:drug/metabolite transporter (DMT)-like permease
MATISTSRPEQNSIAAIALRIGAISCFAFMSAMVKLGLEAGIGIIELVFYRCAFGLPPLLAWIFLSRNVEVWRTKRVRSHLLRVFVGLGAMALGYTSLRFLPLAEAVTISFAAPLFSVMLSAWFLNERVGRHRWSAVALGFIGVMIVMRPGGGDLAHIGVGLALLSALAAAVATILIREVGRTENTQTTVFWFTIISLIATGALMPFGAESHDRSEWLILLALGLAAGFGQLMLTASLRFAPVSVIAPFDYVQLLWAVLLGWLIWQKEPPASTWLGASVIIASGLYTLYREHVRGWNRPPPGPLGGAVGTD